MFLLLLYLLCVWISYEIWKLVAFTHASDYQEGDFIESLMII